MSNYVLSKGATPMNKHFEITMFTTKFCADFAIQNPYKVRSRQTDMTWYQFFAHFALKKQSMTKLARHKLLMQTSIFQSTLHGKPYMYFEEILHIQRQMCSKG